MPPTSPPDLRQFRLIIVDDNPDAGTSLGMLLQYSGYDVFVVQSGQDALDALGDFAPDAMILDLAMPGMSGLELARRVHALPRWTELPLIAVTGHGMDDDRQATKAAGINYHFVKASATEPLLKTLVSLQ
jgi:CheY-like chemotaxis protein